MTFWIALCAVVLCFVIIQAFRYAVNKGHIVLSPTVIFLLFIAIIIILIVVVPTYIRSVLFYEDFIYLKKEVTKLNGNQEYACLADVVNMNFKLEQYQRKINFFMPYDKRIKELTFITLKEYNINDYIWWR